VTCNGSARWNWCGCVYSAYLLCCGVCILCSSVTWCILVHLSCKFRTFKLYCGIVSHLPSFCCLANHPPYFLHSFCSLWVAHHLPHSSCSSLRVSEVFDCLPCGWMAGLTVSYSSPALFCYIFAKPATNFQLRYSLLECKPPLVSSESASTRSVLLWVLLWGW
jgi:hypothetical protein